MDEILQLAQSDASKPLCVVLFLVVATLWKKLATREKEISEKSTRIRLLSELVTRTQGLRIEDQKEHSRQQRQLMVNLFQASRAASPLSLDDVLELPERDFELRSLPKK